ncbi:hypothetical protein ABK040_014137 [Willaertia magna]
MSTKLSQFLKLSENTFTNNNINTNEIDQQQQTIDYQLLHQHLYNSIVFMDHSFAECFSWNDEFKATSLMNLGACLILDLENSNQWPSFERFKQLKEINKIWKDHSQNIKKELIDTSINFPKKNQTFDNENNTFNKAVFFVTELSSSFEKKLKEAIYHFQLNNLYFYCSFSDGFSEYYQSTLQYIIFSQKNLNNLFIPMKFKSLLNENTLTYSDLIQKAQNLVLQLVSSNPEHREKKTILEFQELPIEYQLLYKKLAAVYKRYLQNLIEEERYNTNQSCTFILIDRTLDLVSPLCHSDNIYDKLLNTFNRISDRSMNITSNDKNTI